MKSDFSSKVKVIANLETSTDVKKNSYPPIIEGTTTFDTQGGLVMIHDLVFSATPGQKYYLSFTSDGIDMSK